MGQEEREEEMSVISFPVEVPSQTDTGKDGERRGGGGGKREGREQPQGWREAEPISNLLYDRHSDGRVQPAGLGDSV